MSTVTRTRAELERGIALGWHTGAQLYVWFRGETIADVALGEARPGVAMTPTTLVEWGSATKPVTCAAAGLLWQRGLFDLDDPVCRHVPDFGVNGKKMMESRARIEMVERLADVIIAVEQGHPIRVAIDGGSAAGKSTLADKLVGPIERRGRTAIRAEVDYFYRLDADKRNRTALTAESFSTGLPPAGTPGFGPCRAASPGWGRPRPKLWRGRSARRSA